MAENQAAATPRHLWIVGIVALLWNLFGAMDYVMTQTQNEAYMSNFSPEQLELYYNYPSWLVAFWAIAVWGAVAGSVLLLLRRKLAMTVYLVSFLSMIVTTIYNYGFTGAADVTSGFEFAISAIIFVVALALVIYARAMVRKNVLV